MSKDIKLIAVDLDHTLLNSEHKVSERNEKALRAAMDKGVQIVLATGKTFSSAEPFIQKLGLQTPGIFVQGLVVYNPDGSIRHQQTLDPSIARRVLTFAEDRGFPMLAYSGNRLLERSANPTIEAIAAYGEPKPEPVGPLQNILGEIPVHKLIAFGDPKRLKSLRWQLKMQLNGQITVTSAQVVNMLEILPPGASKGKALRAVIKELGIKPEEVLAIGDGENDSDMLELAGIGVAMGNADAALKEIADQIVADYDHDGVAEAVEMFVTGKLEPEAVAETPETKTQTPAAPAEKTQEEQAE